MLSSTESPFSLAANTHRHQDGDFKTFHHAGARHASHPLRRPGPHPPSRARGPGPAAGRGGQRRRDLVHHATHAAAAQWRQRVARRRPESGPGWRTWHAGRAWRAGPDPAADHLRRPADHASRRARADLRAHRGVHGHAAERRYRAHHARGPDAARQRRADPHPPGKVHARGPQPHPHGAVVAVADRRADLARQDRHGQRDQAGRQPSVPPLPDGQYVTDVLFTAFVVQ